VTVAKDHYETHEVGRRSGRGGSHRRRSILRCASPTSRPMAPLRVGRHLARDVRFEVIEVLVPHSPVKGIRSFRRECMARPCGPPEESFAGATADYRPAIPSAALC
jgi:hypothetical protein